MRCHEDNDKALPTPLCSGFSECPRRLRLQHSDEEIIYFEYGGGQWEVVHTTERDTGSDGYLLGPCTRV